MTVPIEGFSGEYRWLSNFWPSPFTFNNWDWPTVEHAYVAHKVKPIRLALMATKVIAMTPGQAKRYGRVVSMRPDFDVIKLHLMQALQMRKYGQNEDLLAKLIDTGDSHIEETNTWGDTFWGVSGGVGENHLGRILMGVRSHYRSDSHI